MADAKQNLQNAKNKWNNGKREITFKPFHYTCSDGCCDDYGTNIYINDFLISSDGDNVESIVESIMEFLGIDDVEVNYEYEDDYFDDIF